MIIRRMASAIRQQNWSTLAIELLVVIVGIFLGLQVDGWNEARKEAAQERIYLERLSADIDKMIAQHAAHEEEALARLDSVYVTLDALRSCTLTDENTASFDNTLLNHQGLERLIVVRSSYDEMVASGALARIDDSALKSQISELYSEAIAAQQVIEYFTDDLGRASDIIWRHVSFDLKPEAVSSRDSLEVWAGEEYSQTVTYDFESLCGESTFRNALVEVYDSVKDRLGVGSNFSQQLVILRDLIDDRLTAKP